MLKEGDERGRYRNDLRGGHVHVLDAVGCRQREFVLEATGNQAIDELAVLVDLRIRLRNDEVAFLDRRQKIDLVRDFSVYDFPVGRLQKSVPVGAGVERERVDQADVRAFRCLDGADPAIVSRVHVAHLEAPRSRVRPPGPRADTRRLCVISESGFVWSMNCDSWLEPKNSLIAAEMGFALMRSCGMRFSDSACDRRSFTARSTRTKPARNWFSASSPTERTRRLPRWSMSSISPRPLRSSTRIPTTARISSFDSVPRPSAPCGPTRA